MFSNIDPGSETTDIVTTAATTLNGVSNSNGVVTTDMTGGGTTDVTTQNGDSLLWQWHE